MTKKNILKLEELAEEKANIKTALSRIFCIIENIDFVLDDGNVNKDVSSLSLPRTLTEDLKDWEAKTFTILNKKIKALEL